MNPLPLPPLIILGMHRSGTSMVARALESMGLFLGRRQDPNAEARFFLDLNRWLLRQCGGSWETPEAVDALLDDAEVRPLAVDYLRAVVASPRCAGFLGALGYLRHGPLSRAGIGWGWKDPRNTFTLPLWLEVFPAARVLHVVRHGVDVAASVMDRRQRDLRQAAASAEQRNRWHWLRPRVHGFTTPMTIRSMDDAMELWERYFSRGRRHVESLGDRAMEVRYEDVLADPVRRLGEMARFAGLTPSDQALQSTAGTLRTARAFAYRENDKRVECARRHAGRLARWGYTDDE